MDILTVLRANIRHQKGSFFSILILMLMVSVALTSVLTVSINSEKSEWEALEHAGFGELLTELYDEDEGKIENLIRETEENEHVEKVEVEEVIYGDIEDINGKNPSNSVVLEREGTFDFRVYDEAGTGFLKNPESLKAKEVGVPICFTSLYGCKLGDKVRFKSQNGTLEYTIKYFFEDPFMGGSMMGIKTILMQKEELKSLRGTVKAGKDPVLETGVMLNIFQKESSDLSYLKFIQNLNQDTGLLGYGWIGMGTVQAVNYMLILTNIFSGILLLFIVLLLVITLIIMSHSISTSMEMEYVNLGILKAVGFSQGKLKMILTLQYLLGLIAGAVLGIPLAIPIVNAINRIVIPVIGIRILGEMPIGICLAAELLILGCILLFISVKLRRLKAITPVRAICQGRESIYFSSPLELPIRKRGLSFWLAFRQMISNRKQYAAAGVIAALLVFFLIVMGNASEGMGDDGKEFAKMFDVTEQDLEICYNDSRIQQEAEKKISEYTQIDRKFQLSSLYLLLDGCQCYCYIIDDPEEYHTILEGRTCKYDNEILITEFVAKDLELDIGDTVTVSFKDNKAEYLICGIYQSANDMGVNFAMNQKGYLRLKQQAELPKGLLVNQMYRLKEAVYAEQIAEDLNQYYGEKIRVQTTGEGTSGMDSAAAATGAVTALTYGLAVIFVLVVIFLVCGKIFAKERQDYGIYKAMGFTSGQLRLQFALRFLVVAFLGSLFGVALSIPLINPCMEAVLSLVGVSHVEVELSLVSTTVPAAMMTAVFFLFSWLLSGRIKRVEPRILIVE